MRRGDAYSTAIFDQSQLCYSAMVMARCVTVPLPQSCIGERMVMVSSRAMVIHGMNSETASSAWLDDQLKPSAIPPPTTAVEIRNERRETLSNLPMYSSPYADSFSAAWWIASR